MNRIEAALETVSSLCEMRNPPLNRIAHALALAKVGAVAGGKYARTESLRAVMPGDTYRSANLQSLIRVGEVESIIDAVGRKGYRLTKAGEQLVMTAIGRTRKPKAERSLP